MGLTKREYVQLTMDPLYILFVTGDGWKVPSCFIAISDIRYIHATSHRHLLRENGPGIDFDQLDDGSLGLACKGETRIRVDSHRVMPDQLVIGNVSLVEESDHGFAVALADRLDNICRFLRQIRERQGAGSGDYEDSPDHWENPEWVSFQAAEILPLSPENRQLKTR